MDREIAELEKAIERIWEIGHSYGLDPFPTNFEIVPSTVMYEIGSYALPGRYSHWTFGKAYNLSGGETLSYLEMVRRIFVAQNLKPRFVRVPILAPSSSRTAESVRRRASDARPTCCARTRRG